MESNSAKRQVFFWVVSGLFLAFTVAWCVKLGFGNLKAASLAFALSAAAFAVGSLLGFLFSIFGEEVEPLGKIRDAMIALASGITGIGIAKAKEFALLVGSIHVFSDDPERNSSFTVLFVVMYFVSGFYFMYLVRKLVLNPALADALNAMNRIQITGDVGQVAARIREKLSQSVLLGREFIEEVEGLGSEDEVQLRADLFSEEVSKFLSACEIDAAKGVVLQPENAEIAARLHYYRLYFEKSGTDARRSEEQKAIEWINRVLTRDPTNPEFQIKLADIYGLRGRYDEAVSIAARLERDDSSPQYVQQWLGYFLLFLDGREEEAIKQSLAYHERFPDESSALFNASCGYAQLYTAELRDNGVKEFLESINRAKSLELLRQAISNDPDLKAFAKRHSGAGASFESLSNDKKFQDLTSEYPSSSATEPSH